MNETLKINFKLWFYTVKNICTETDSKYAKIPQMLEIV
jgi:hypothetical protein